MTNHSPYLFEQTTPVTSLVIGETDVELVAWSPQAPKSIKDLKESARMEEGSEEAHELSLPGWAKNTFWLVAQRLRKKARPSNLLKFLEDSALHKNFAKLEEADDFKKFAEKHGFLGGPMALVRHQGRLQPAEAVNEWKWQVFRMKTLITIVELLNRGDSESMKKLAGLFSFGPVVPEFDDATREWRTPSRFECCFDPEFAKRRGVSPRGRAWRSVPYEEPVNALSGVSSQDVEGIKKALSLELDSHVEDALSEVMPPANILDIAKVMLLGEINRELERGTSVRVDPAHSDRIQILVKGLRAAVYCSLMFEVTEQSSLLRRCATCGDWFETMDARTKFCKREHRKSHNRRAKTATNQEEL